MGSHFVLSSSSTHSILTASPTLALEVGSYVMHLKICLTNYVSATCAEFDSNFEVTGCVVTAFSMISLSTTYDKIYKVSDPALAWPLAIAGLTR